MDEKKAKTGIEEAMDLLCSQCIYRVPVYCESCRIKKLLDAAAATIESLTAQLEMARAERDAVTRRMIELEQTQGGAQSDEGDLQGTRRGPGDP